MRRPTLCGFLVGQEVHEGSAGELDAQEGEDEAEGGVPVGVEEADDAAWELMEELGAVAEAEETKWQQQVVPLSLPVQSVW